MEKNSVKGIEQIQDISIPCVEQLPHATTFQALTLPSSVLACFSFSVVNTSFSIPAKPCYVIPNPALHCTALLTIDLAISNNRARVIIPCTVL